MAEEMKKLSMERNEALKRVLSQLANGNVGLSLTELQNFFAVYPRPQAQAEMDSLLAEYQVMSRYWMQGYQDPQLSSNYSQLLQRTYRLYADTSLWRRIGSSPFISTTYSNLLMSSREWSVNNIRQELESFVTDVAMVGLEPANKQLPHREALYARHQQFVNSLFNYIWTSGQWSDAKSKAFEEMLLSPTVDSADQQLMVSALTLSLLNAFDMAKLRTLLNVCRQATDEQVRQRALVGWVMGRNYTLSSVFPEEQQLVDELLQDEQMVQELTELQLQMIYAMSAEQDHHTIQSEIMPDLLKNNHFRITRNGVEEVEEDSLEDILHPEAEEERMEKVEESFRRMIDMQKQGSDIYFGGFSQMKRFSFFQTIANWFMPFTMYHPDVAVAMKSLHTNRFLQQLLKTGPFCNSDKYSFVLGFSQVLERLPQSMRDMMERGEATMGELPEEEIQSAAYIRRMYLQDLYRFFRLFPHAAQFDHPFGHSDGLEHVLFFVSPLFKGSPLEKNFDKVASMLIRRHYNEDAERLLKRFGDAYRDYHYYMMEATVIQRLKGTGAAHDKQARLATAYQKAMALKPDSERALLGYARALFGMEQYEEALNVFETLVGKYPEKRSYVLQQTVCLSNLGRFDEALEPLFRLNYETPDDLNVKRVLAWALTGAGKYEQALPLYVQLTTLEESSDEDFLNQGYCFWFSGNPKKAVDSFCHYLENTGQQASCIVKNEQTLILQKGISMPEIQMMLSAIAPSHGGSPT